MSRQSTISFPIRKNNFYGTKDSTPKIDYSNASLRSTPSSRYTPTTKKIVDISSDSDSDCENNVENIDIKATPRKRKVRRNVATACQSSPPKQKKILSPAKTPSTAFNKLSIRSSSKTSPKTMKDKLTPKKLFSSNYSRYSDARKALHSALPENLIGRDSEMDFLEKFIDTHHSKKSSTSLYISGPPGTGKTACLSKIMLKPRYKNAFQIVYVNCTSMKSAAAIYSKIIEELKIKKPKSNKQNKSAIQAYLSSSRTKMLLLVLDEMDQLESKNQAVLYSIFEWPLIPKSKLILVGIANALDLTDRILPRLQAKCELKPTLLHFQPYSKEQIINIISERLKEAKASDIFTSAAMQLLSSKVAAVSGDIRRALDIGRRLIEIAESEQLNLSKADNGVQQAASSCEAELQKAVDFKEVRSVLNEVYGGSRNIDSAESAFPMQQKILLCSLMLILNNAKNTNVNIGMLYQVYKKVCTKRKIHVIDISEFVSMCTLIETRGILKVSMKKEARLSKIALEWDQELLTSALEDKVLTSDIVNDVSCI